MKRYDSYKDSGVEWIGEIPSHWDVTRIKYQYQIGRGRVISNEDLVDNGIYPVYSSQTLNNGCLGFIDTYDFDDKLITWTTDGANAGTVFLREGKFNCTNVCGTLKAKSDDIIPEFHYYFLQYATQFYKRPDTNGAKIMNNEMAVILSLKLSSDEQTAIANYLDQKTSEIDNLIAKKERLIQLLEEERTAIINQAVTKGLDPSVPMKDSGIEWLGEIPAHWEVKRIKYIGKIISGYSFKSEDFTQTGVRVMKISNIQTMRVDWSDDSYLPENFLTEYERFKINKGDLVFALTRPIISTGIKATIVNEQENILLNQRNAVLKSGDKLYVRWMYYMIFNEKFKEHFESLIDGTGQQPNISSNDIANINIPIPELNEQNEIVEFLDSKMENVETIISKYQKEIELLKEYKTALISKVVTGKVDVRDEKLN